MPRPQHFRRIGGLPPCRIYKPQGVPQSMLEHVNLTEDEWEAIRLADLEKLLHEQAAEQMNISRQTFGRILDLAHRKIADALINGKALVIEGGRVEVSPPVFGRFSQPGPGRGRCGRRGRRWNQ